ncbi:MAG: hypothetical protein M3406_08220 [Chloroflexota bacterium]|nr:hypothetical protein [Chloroflexota bacterium]
MTTEWPARRTSNGNVLCGRMVDGQHACQGPIGAIDDTGQFYFLPGVIEEPERPGWCNPTARSERRIKQGHLPRWHRTVRATTGERVLVWKSPSLPARYPCPHCRCIAVIDESVAET